MSQKIVAIKTIPFAGGVDLAHEAVALPNGALSQDQNLRPRRPGKESRLGQARHHTTITQDPGLKSSFETLEFDESATGIQDISYAPNDTLWVCDNNTEKIYNIELDGTPISEFETLEFDENATGITGISYAPNDTLWVCDSDTDKIYNIELDGTPISEFETSVFDASATVTRGVSYAPNDTLWVCDNNTDKIYNIELDGTPISEFETLEFDESATGIRGVNCASDDTLWVCDSDTDKIYNIELDGTPISEFETLEFDENAVSSQGVIHVPDGTLWVCDNATDKIYNITLHAPVISGYGFSKSEITERHLFAQYSDGSVDEATDNPPTVTTGNFGSPVLPARSNPWPASWAKFRDMFIYTDGAGMGQIYTGQNMKPIFFNVYRGTAATIPDIPEEGADYTQEIIDDLSSTVADLTELDIFTEENCLFIGFDTPINKITFTMVAANDDATTATVAYRKSDSTWEDVSGFSDGTSASSKSLNQSGDMTWTLPTDEVSHYAFSNSCFVYRIVFSAKLDNTSVTVSAITGENTSGFEGIQNVWDGIMPEATIALVKDSSAGTFATWSSQAILCGDLVGAASHDYLYISSPDPLFGVYLGVGGTPNTTEATTIDQIATWTGVTFTALSGLSANDGGASTGFITWAREPDSRKVNFNGTVQHAYWYRFRFDKTLSSNLTWSILTLPYFDINEIYPVMQAACAWDNRVWYSFNDNMLYGTDVNKPMTLNGSNLVLVEAAKHSKNKAICMRRFYQFMLVWGEEKGEEGGYFSIIQPGATATGYDSQVISERIGIMNNKCAVTLEDSNMGDLNTERPIMKGVYFLSRSGVYKSDGSFLKNISGAIGNYFDPTRSECIRRGYEKEHFLSWDSTYGVIRLGLVSGGDATVPNKHFIFDTVSDTWHEDVLGQQLSSIFEIDGASGDIPVLQYGGGQDGYVYRLNTGDNDVSTAIDKSLKIELDGEGHQLRLKGMSLVFKHQTAGDIVVDVYVNGVAASAYTQTLTMISSVGDYKGHRFNCDVVGDHLTIRLRNNTVGQPVYLLEYGFDIDRIENNIAYD